MAFKLPPAFWAVVYGLQNAITGLLGLKSAGILADRKPGAGDFEGGKDKTVNDGR